MGVGRLRGPQDAVEIRFGVAKGNIVRDGFVEDMIFLEDEADVLAQVAVIECLDIGVVVVDYALVGSTRPARSLVRVVLPQPLRPTRATVLPGGISRVMSLRMDGESGPP